MNNNVAIVINAKCGRGKRAIINNQSSLSFNFFLLNLFLLCCCFLFCFIHSFIHSFLFKYTINVCARIHTSLLLIDDRLVEINTYTQHYTTQHIHSFIRIHLLTFACTFDYHGWLVKKRFIAGKFHVACFLIFIQQINSPSHWYHASR